MTPRWIAFEGGECSGKSTQAALLAARLDATLTREPGGTPVGERIRALSLDPAVTVDTRAEALLMAADRAEHVARVVAPALAAGRHVVSDRSAYSSLAYQGFGRGLPLDDVRRISDWASGGRWPDVVVLLDVGDDERAARMQRSRDRMEAAGDDFHDRVHAGFRALADAEPDRWLVIDGVGEVDDVAATIAARYAAWAAERVDA